MAMRPEDWNNPVVTEVIAGVILFILILMAFGKL